MLGAGLPIASGDGDDFPRICCATCARQLAHRAASRVGEREAIAAGRRFAGGARSTIAADAPPAAACVQKIMPVKILAAQRDKQRPARHPPRVRADRGESAISRAPPQRISAAPVTFANFCQRQWVSCLTLFATTFSEHFRRFFHIVEMMPGSARRSGNSRAPCRRSAPHRRFGVFQNFADRRPPIRLDDDRLSPGPAEIPSTISSMISPASSVRGLSLVT